jgi:hypothetical protein
VATADDQRPLPSWASARWNEAEFRLRLPFDHRSTGSRKLHDHPDPPPRRPSISTGSTSRPATASFAAPGGLATAALIGSRGERMLRITLPHVDAWNVWFSDTDNSPAGVPRLRDLVDGVWTETAVLVLLRIDAGDRFGAAVAFDGTMFIVGVFGWTLFFCSAG